MAEAWIEDATSWLNQSLGPLPQELNAIDWKSALSPKTERLAQHLSAFANREGGGYLAFGLHDDGQSAPLSKEIADDVVRKLVGIARNNLSESLTLDSATVMHQGHPVLLIRIPEGNDRPVRLSGKDPYAAYKRSAGHTVLMTRKEVELLLATSGSGSFEEGTAARDLNSDAVLQQLDYDSYFQLTKTRLPDTKAGILKILDEEGLIVQAPASSWHITNKGALLFGRDLRAFKALNTKTPRAIVYEGSSRIQVKDGKDIEGRYGYASSFQGLIQWIMEQLPTSEIIAAALRKEEKMYPEVAVREFVANALIHQDFTVIGSRVMIEIFADRIEITNPGVPLMDTARFIDTIPKSRNENMANMMRRLRICELRGSGVDRAIEAIEEYGMPAPKFIREEDYTRVILYAPAPLERMTIEDRARACYQHTCLHYVNNQLVNNTSVRKRFGISKQNYTMASKILADTIALGWIKPSDPDNAAKKFATYIPFWA